MESINNGNKCLLIIKAGYTSCEIIISSYEKNNINNVRAYMAVQ
jgi:hypothetical protein